MVLSRQVEHRVFVVIAARLQDLTSILTRAFTHPWVASYQVGFGPPLIRSSDHLLFRLKSARSSLDKLAAYLEVCIFDPEERARLAAMHRQMLIGRHGPIEAEVLAASSADVLDLNFRLYPPAEAPGAVRRQMEQAAAPAVDSALAPEDHSARFVVHLFDPRNTRLLHVDAVAREADMHSEPLAVELRVPAALFELWQIFIRDYESLTGYSVVGLEEPGPRARVVRDGTRR